MASTNARQTGVFIAVLLIILSGWAMSLAPAHADEKSDARKLLQAGDKYIQRGDRYKDRGKESRAVKYYERALESYQKAHRLVPKVTIYYAIANAEVKLGRYLEAVEHYQQVIDEVDNDELKAQAQSALDTGARPHLAAVVLRIKPEGAEISVDGQLRGVAPLQKPLYLLPGEHIVTVTAEGFTPHEDTLTLEAGIEIEREVELEGIPVIVKKPKIEPRSPDEPDQRRKSRPTRLRKPGKGSLILGSALAVSLGAGATFTGLSAVSRESTANDESASLAARDDARSSGKTLALVTDVLVIGAVAAAAYTTYQYFSVYRPKARAYEEQERRRNDPKYWASPYVHGNGGGLVFGGRF